MQVVTNPTRIRSAKLRVHIKEQILFCMITDFMQTYMYINEDKINPHLKNFSDFWLNLQGIENVQYDSGMSSPTGEVRVKISLLPCASDKGP